MKRFNFFKYTTLANKVHTTYFEYWFFKHLTQGGEAPTEPVEGEGTEFTLSPTSNKKLAVVTPKGDTSQNTLSGKNKLSLGLVTPAIQQGMSITSSDNNSISIATTETVGNFYTVRYNIPLTDLGVSIGDTLTISMASITGSFTGYRGATCRICKNASGLSDNIITTLNTDKLDSSFTIPADTTSLGVFFYITYGQAGVEGLTATFSNIQLEAGSTATTYEPYCGGIPSPNPDYPQDVNVVTGTQTLTITNGTDVQTYPITLGSVELCKIGTYQDYIYKSGDKWYVKKKTASVAVKDNIYWSINNNCFQGTPYVGKKSDSICMCTHFTFNPIRSGITSNLKDGEFGFNTSDTPTFKYTTITTTTAWNTWLSDNNPILYYILATPTDTEITDTTLLSNLNTLLTDGYLKKGTNTIKTTATGTNLPTIIYIKTN